MRLQLQISSVVYMKAMTADLLRVKREGAERSRRLAKTLTSHEDQARLLAFADELDAQADALQEAAQVPPPSDTQEQTEDRTPTINTSDNKA